MQYDPTSESNWSSQPESSISTGISTFESPPATPLANPTQLDTPFAGQPLSTTGPWETQSLDVAPLSNSGLGKSAADDNPSDRPWNSASQATPLPFATQFQPSSEPSDQAQPDQIESDTDNTWQSTLASTSLNSTPDEMPAAPSSTDSGAVTPCAFDLAGDIQSDLLDQKDPINSLDQTAQVAGTTNSEGPEKEHQIVFDAASGRTNQALLRLNAGRKFGRNKKGDGAPRTAKTESQYTERVRGLYLRSTDSRTIDPQNPVQPSPMDLVDDLISSAVGVPGHPYRAPSSFALYRSALLWFMHSKIQTSKEFAEAYKKLAATKHPAGTKKAKKSKVVFKGNDFSMIINTLGTLNNRGQIWGSATAYWLQAGVACGARTSEWVGTSWLNRENLELLIPNSKRKFSPPAFAKMNNHPGATTIYEIEIEEQLMQQATTGAAEEDLEDDDDDDEIVTSEFNISTGNGRDLGLDSHRVVTVDRNDAVFVDLQLNAMERGIQEKMKEGISRQEAFDRYVNMVRRTLRKACSIAFRGTRYYRLYNTRSQFAANKKVDHPLGIVASMMGHVDTRTTMSSYGSRAAGLKGRRAQVDTQNQSTLDTFNFDDIGADIDESQTFDGAATQAPPSPV